MKVYRMRYTTDRSPISSSVERDNALGLRRRMDTGKLQPDLYDEL
jgi:hypothetical protein